LILWTGLGEEGVTIAEAWATKLNGTTLSQTPGGKYLSSLDLYAPASVVTPMEATEIFGAVSKVAVEQASGNVRSILGAVHGNSIYRRIELPTLRTNPNITGLQPLQILPQNEIWGPILRTIDEAHPGGG
jgi:hypothetical protein